MIPKRLILKGAKGLKAGIGVDEIDLNLASLPSGLVAITGQNGAGKTSILDSLTPYRIQAYKVRQSGEWSTSSFSYYDHFDGSDGRKELWWSMAGREFKTLILIDAPRRRQECYLHELVNGQWVPYPGCSGKTKEYDAAVEEICGSPTLFFSSVFRCQSARSLSDYRRSEIMSILSELLAVDHIKEQSIKCTSVVQQLKARVDVTRASVASVQADIEAAAGHEARIAELEVVLADLHRQVAVANAAHVDAAEEVVRCERVAAASDSDNARRIQLQTALGAEHSRHNKERERISTEQKRLQVSRQRIETDFLAKSNDFNQRIERAEKIVSGAEKIREAVDAEVLVKSNLLRFREELSGVEPVHTQLSHKMSDSNGRLKAFEAKISAAVANASKLSDIDCRGDGSGWINGNCRFVSSAVDDREALPALEAEVAVLRSAVGAINADINGVLGQRSLLQAAIAGAEQELDVLGKFTRLVGELDAAESNLALWRTDLAAVAAERDSAIADIDSQLSGLYTADFEEDAANVAEVQRLEAEIAAVPSSSGATLALVGAKSKADFANAECSRLQVSIRQTENEAVGLRAKLENVAVKRESLAVADAEIAKYNSLIADFALLGKACSNDGIVALELDDAAPSIAAIVNDLLSSCYGSRFSVRMDTQAQKADGGVREAFDIVVYDSETDSERSITEMSGGQINWIEDAITRGISLFNIHRSDRSFGTLFSDEKDGALSPDRKMEFFAVKRKAMEIGTHCREYFITQTDSLVELADARIVLEPGRVTIQ